MKIIETKSSRLPYFGKDETQAVAVITVLVQDQTGLVAAYQGVTHCDVFKTKSERNAMDQKIIYFGIKLTNREAVKVFGNIKQPYHR